MRSGAKAAPCLCAPILVPAPKPSQNCSPYLRQSDMEGPKMRRGRWASEGHQTPLSSGFPANPFGALLSLPKAGAQDFVCWHMSGNEVGCQPKAGTGTICSSPRGPKTTVWRWVFVFPGQSPLAIWSRRGAHLNGGGEGFEFGGGAVGDAFQAPLACLQLKLKLLGLFICGF